MEFSLKLQKSSQKKRKKTKASLFYKESCHKTIVYCIAFFKINKKKLLRCEKSVNKKEKKNHCVKKKKKKE